MAEFAGIATCTAWLLCDEIVFPSFVGQQVADKYSQYVFMLSKPRSDSSASIGAVWNMPGTKNA